jgi:hypothetical protein
MPNNDHRYMFKFRSERIPHSHLLQESRELLHSCQCLPIGLLSRAFVCQDLSEQGKEGGEGTAY